MRRLVFRPDFEPDNAFSFDGDVDRMAAILEDHGCTASREDIRLAWEAYSDGVCASWLCLPEDDEVLHATLMRFLHDE